MMSLPGKDELRRALSADGFVSAKAVDVTRAVREICQLQDCLPLAATAPLGAASRHGHAFDVMGDLATNDGWAGHQTRHHDVLVE